MDLQDAINKSHEAEEARIKAENKERERLFKEKIAKRNADNAARPQVVPAQFDAPFFGKETKVCQDGNSALFAMIDEATFEPLAYRVRSNAVDYNFPIEINQRMAFEKCHAKFLELVYAMNRQALGL
jgi:hypothetical protein